MTTVLLVGKPNVGKSTLFNVLTSSRQAVGNWPGVTVKTASASVRDWRFVDLPGFESFFCDPLTLSPDQRQSLEVLQQGRYDVLVQVLDVVHLEKNLVLTAELLTLQRPMVLALTHNDLLPVSVQTEALQEALGCPVVLLPMRENGRYDLRALYAALSSLPAPNTAPPGLLSPSKQAELWVALAIDPSLLRGARARLYALDRIFFAPFLGDPDSFVFSCGDFWSRVVLRRGCSIV